MYVQCKCKVPEDKTGRKQQKRNRITRCKCHFIETKIEQKQQKECDKLAYHKRRNQTNDNDDIEPSYLGLQVICDYCKAKKFIGEPKSLCYNDGKIVL
ncbi:17498_t:CDS:2, partial [Cetraspora pellucida]